MDVEAHSLPATQKANLLLKLRDDLEPGMGYHVNVSPQPSCHLDGSALLQ